MIIIERLFVFIGLITIIAALGISASDTWSRYFLVVVISGGVAIILGILLWLERPSALEREILNEDSIEYPEDWPN